jgi:hypothetical protein
MHRRRRGHGLTDERNADPARLADGAVVSKTEPSAAGASAKGNIRVDDIETVPRDETSVMTTGSYDGLKFALDCGIDIWDLAETLTLQKLIADVGTPAQKKRLAETLIASRWTTEIENAK